jgi:hypothetical protein
MVLTTVLAMRFTEEFTPWNSIQYPEAIFHSQVGFLDINAL